MTIALNVGLRSGAGNLHWASTSIPWPDQEDGHETAPVGDMWTILVMRLKSANATTALSFEFLSKEDDVYDRMNDRGGEKVLHRITFRSDYLVQGDVQDIPVRFSALGFEADGYLTLRF
jgi:hypothetical protein